MKSILFALILFISFSVFSQNQYKVNIQADIRGHSCSGGFGFCSSSIITEIANSNIIAQKIDSNTILFTIDKASMTIENQKSIVGKEFLKLSPTSIFDFIQITDTWISEEILLKIGINPKFSQISKGNYPMKIEKDKIYITFKLSEKI